MVTPDNEYTIGNSGDQEMIDRVTEHLGTGYLNYSPEIAAGFDTGDLGDSDPRLRATNKITGEETARGGSGPKK